MAVSFTSDYTPPSGMEWQAPPQISSESYRVGWCNELIEEGNAWLRSQRGSTDFNRALDTIAGKDTLLTSASYRSHIDPNRLKRNIRVIISALSKLRPMWGYYSENKAFSKSAGMLNNVIKAWYLRTMVDRSVKEALAWCAATNRGWMRPMYTRKMYGQGRGDIYIKTYGQPSVLPSQLPADNNWQEAYTVTFLDDTPVAKAHGMFPAFQHLLKPSRSSYWYSNKVGKASQGSLVRRMFGMFKRDAVSNELADLLVSLRSHYILDLSINTTGTNPKTAQMIPMGEPGSSWFYRVPYIGQEIPCGRDKDGQLLTRKADENDARLYPRRRLIISADNCIPYDGPAFDWHGMMPGVSFCLDDWPWEPIGFSPVHDGYQINESLKALYRGNMDKARAGLDPAMAYDTNAVATREARGFDPMEPKARVGFDGNATEKPFAPALDPAFYSLDATYLEFIKMLEAALDSQSAINDLQALMRSRAAGAMSDLDKILEANGPIVEDMSRSMEPPMRDLGTMVKYLVLQYYDTPRVMQMVGADGVAPETFDYDPASLIPSHMPGEDPTQGESSFSRMERARTFADNLEFYVMPNSLHEITQMTMKLGLIQLRKAGVGIDDQTLCEAWQVPSFGTIDGNTVRERWQTQQEEQLEQAARMKAIAGEEGLLPAAPPGAPGPGGGNPEGRPPSGNAAPQLKTKDNGARSTITESK